MLRWKRSRNGLKKTKYMMVKIGKEREGIARKIKIRSSTEN